ncbi:F-box/LRR-repeat protein At5g63520-like isoform X1 [Brassica napus]|uniref:F-box/LRR-repeat protein At5g63520-like isoform X1 n=1 Tax=Brassica napus TaxID=3708 RepID=UPI0006AA8BA5|nr:F-box/LRR-repeat protein At5g63520-like isoform X1 [Brassica napus]
MEKSKKTDMAFIASMNDDLLQNILLRLPAKPFAFASCVNRSWNIVCNRILSRPKMVSAFSRNPHQFEAVEEAIDKALSEPIRPDFVIANITCGNMEDTLSLITKRVGTRVPVIVSIVAGVLGKEVCNDKAGEVKQNDQGMHICPSFAILLTIGYLPGIKVDVIPVIQSKEETEAMIGDKFVMDIRNFVSEVSDHAEPACLMLFGEDTHATEPIIRKLDYAMPAETIIVGDQKGEFLQKRANELSNAQLHKDESRVLAGLIFARDRRRPIEAGRVQFHTAISRGLSPVDLRYKVANAISTLPKWPATLMTAKRIGEAEVLNGEQILDDIEANLLGNPLWEADPYIGVIKRRKYSVGLDQKPKIMASLVFHQVTGADEQYLTVNGAGIKTGDHFQVYLPDLEVAEASLTAVSSQLRNIMSKPNKHEVVGGFVFAGSGRGDSFFGRPNADTSPFLENFPELRFGGVFCDGEIGRSLSVEEGEEKQVTISQRCLHVVSSVYLIVSYACS